MNSAKYPSNKPISKMTDNELEQLCYDLKDNDPRMKEAELEMLRRAYDASDDSAQRNPS